MANEKQASGETITELAHRHLKDQSHSTTDEELRNARVVVDGSVSEVKEDSSSPNFPEKVQPLEIDKLISKEENPEQKVPNPYDVLG